jgi:hypothetical protein
LVNYKGPLRRFTDPEMKYLSTHPHSYSRCPETGNLIIEELPAQSKSKRDIEIESRAKDFKNYYLEHPEKRQYPIRTIFDKDDTKT